MMQIMLAVLLCKCLRFAGKLLGKGSSLPGKITLKLFPNILKALTLPKTIVAVTGSNGKTSSTEMIAAVFEAAGMKTIYNKEGSNQIEGVATLLLCSCGLNGVVRADAIVLESDERYARHTFLHFSPTHYIINNLYRDQLTRNGHPRWLWSIIEESIRENSTLILNGDDPLVRLFGYQRENCVYFSMAENDFSTLDLQNCYNDCTYCPVCGAKMDYSYHHYNHIGDYRCTVCDFGRPIPSYQITSVNLEDGYMLLDGDNQINLSLKSLYNAYNILAVYSLCRSLHIHQTLICNTLSDYVMKNDRISAFRLRGKTGVLYTSKHENSISYNQSISMALREETVSTVLFIVDAISRKYYTCESSWLWDIDFQRLNENSRLEKIYLAGAYCYDLALRFRETGISPEQIQVFPEIGDALQAFETNHTQKLIVITCFSDRDKLLNKVEKL